jgi:hypothetical protein
MGNNTRMVVAAYRAGVTAQQIERRPPPPWRRRILAFALASLLVPAGASAAHGGHPIRLSDLSQQSAVRPVTFALTSTAAMGALRWTSWGGPSATAFGDLTVSTCQPTCAAGKTRTVADTELQVAGERVDHGQPYYGRYRLVNPAFTRQDRAAFAAWTTTYVPGDFQSSGP